MAAIDGVYPSIQAPIGACKKRPGETRQSDTRQSDNHVSAILFHTLLSLDVLHTT